MRNWSLATLMYIHSNGSNVTLLDGHVERVPFKALWEIDARRRVAHSFWYIED